MLRLALRVRRAAFEVAAELTVGEGEVLCLLGHTGAGKTTLLHALAGTQAATGTAAIDGRDLTALPPHRRAVALVPQRSRPLPHGSVAAQIAFAAPDGRLGPDVEALVDRFDLRNLLGRQGRQLSGGEAQRLAIVQALASRPSAVALDEPLSAQDPGRRRALGPRLRAYAREHGLPLVWATHDVAEAQRVADRVAVMEEGRVVLDTPVERMLEAPPTWHAAHLLGYDGWAPLGGGEAVLFHPDRIRLDTAPPAPGEVALTARVWEVRPHGGGVLVHLVLEPAGEATVALHGTPPPAPGETVRLIAPDTPRLPLEANAMPW